MAQTRYLATASSAVACTQLRPTPVTSTGRCLRRLAVKVHALQPQGRIAARISVHSKPDEKQLKALDVKAWPIWECGVSNFSWSYSEKETAFMLEGRVIVTPDGGEPTEIVAGDLVVFPEGMSCRWDVQLPIRKHYNFG